MANEKVDVIIVGAGASGSVYAAVMAKQPGVLEQRRRYRSRPLFELLVELVDGGVNRLLDSFVCHLCSPFRILSEATGSYEMGPTIRL